MRFPCAFLRLCVGLSLLYAMNLHAADPQVDYLIRQFQLFFSTPYVDSNGITFYYQGKASSVAISGSFMLWDNPIEMTRYSNNVWILTWNQPLQAGSYQYRLFIDGVWMQDPRNTNTVFGPSQSPLSSFTLTTPILPKDVHPIPLGEGRYLFQMLAPQAKRVSILGDFNHWDPYQHPMQPLGGGRFEITLTLKPGLHTYAFMVEDVWTPDPLNHRQYLDHTGQTINVFLATTNDPFQTTN